MKLVVKLMLFKTYCLSQQAPPVLTAESFNSAKTPQKHSLSSLQKEPFHSASVF